ncbi:MAG: hypothetical protein PHG95_01480 [Patescibacteria group bacterium]|nr:hypothetical protein [Patescibacteria group bacterium]
MNKRSNFFIKRHKLGVAVILLLFSASFLLVPLKPAQAQADVNQAVNNVLTPIWAFLKKAYEKGGASAFQKVVRTALNKIAYDTATWLGSGQEGQKPMFVTQGWGSYLAQIGDEAAGQFIEDAVNNWNNNDWNVDDSEAKTCNDNWEKCLNACSNTEDLDACYSDCDLKNSSCLNGIVSSTAYTGADGVTTTRTAKTVAVCQPSSISAKLTIAMGLVDYNRPTAPNCTASALVQNWDNYIERMTAFKEKDFLDKFAGIFNPVSNDLGIYMSLRTDMTQKMSTEVEDSRTKLIADGGWLDMQDIAGNLVGMPGDAETKKEISEQGYISNMATFSGDALIDAANVFLNQLALTAFNKFMSNLGKTSSSNNSAAISNPSADPNVVYGEVPVKESAASIIEPDFTVRADYDILSSLTMCRDRNNPGPTECVIDDKLMQGVTEKKTVAEAVKGGYLHKEWLFTSDYREGAYSLRNLQIMRKYRIIPIGWEAAAASGKQATLIDLMSCFSATDAYNEYTSNFDVRNQGWCRGLVDPNWVLKAPLNYCAKQGYSAQILDISVVPSASSDGTIADDVQITRADDYCADDKTCIKERADGSCEAYGYCQSERRTWSFASKSCQPIDNTCSAFLNSSSGQKVAYLENTLDYGDCSADSAGCKKYSLNGSYNTENGQVAWSGNPFSTAYFNSKLSACSSSQEGCSEIMRVKPGWGSNLVMGADFAEDNLGDELVNGRINNYWPVWSTGNKSAEIIDASTINPASSGKAMLVESVGNAASTTIGVFSDNAMSLIPSNLNILSGETYTLSADVYLLAGDKIHLVLGGDYATAVQTTDHDVWRHLSVTRSLVENPLSEMSFSVVAYSSTNEARFMLRNLKLEMASWDSGFSAYGSYKVYEKLIPPYLAAVCYENADAGNPDYRLRADAPEVCKNFARQCNRDEAGCERYTEKSTAFSVAAQAVSSDYCDASCDGYDLYVARSSYFYSPYAEKIIPKNSRACSAEAVGCSEFTNLDAAASGGEGKEYYTQLKQCIKPGASCDDFYTWVGTEESGYQLKALVLKKDTNGSPAVTADDSDECNEAIFNLPPSDPGFNPDCRQFYNKAGAVSYHLSAYTVTCSENCHPYRLSENNIDTTLTQSQCSGSDRFWNIASSACYVCKNGGTWSTQYQACIYQAIPDEGVKCAASQNGCREYNGSLGNNTKLIDADSFENGLEGWEGQCGDAALSSQVVSTNNGKSLFYDSGANATGVTQQTNCESQTSVSWLDRFLGKANAALPSHVRKTIGKQAIQGQSYSLKFTAAASVDTTVSFGFRNKNGEIAYFNASDSNPTGSLTVHGDGEWRAFELNLPELNHVVDTAESLIIVANHDFYLDNLILTAISDRYYLIKNSSQVPDVCYYDMLDNYQGADYNLGCSLYSDRTGNSHYLRQFSRLCQDSAVGCELMVNTANYSSYKPGIWKDGDGNGQCDTDESECVSVAGDRFFYAIYDSSYLCNRADSGCSRLGEAVSTGANTDYSDVFKLNQPDNYNNSLCNAGDAGCEAWQYIDGSGISYFKNPGNNACVYRSSTNTDKPGKAWYKVPVMRCDLNNNGKIDITESSAPVCQSADDCSAGRACLVDNNDYDCPVSYNQTIGFGGGGNQVPVPSEAAGLCEAAASGCTEYIDPVSGFSPNLIFNPYLDSSCNGWEPDSCAPPLSQDIILEPNKLYIFALDSYSGNTISYPVSLTFPAGVSLLQEDNTLSTTAISTLTIPANQPSKRFIFYSRGNTAATVSGASNGNPISVKEAIVDYQFKQNIDKQSCNGLVNLDDGCVLFNERSVNGGEGLLSLSGGWNAAASTNGQAPVNCVSGNCSANTLIKVRPDRVCATWLDCLTYVVDPVTNQRTCYAIGECNRLNDNNECANFTNAGQGALLNGENDIAVMSKIDGYSVLNQYYFAGMKEVGLNTEAHYNFEEGSPSLTCRYVNTPLISCSFDNGIVADSVINNPKNAPTDYPAEGRAYLKVMSSQQISPHADNAPVSIQPNQDYYVNYLLNTKGSGLNGKVWVYNATNGSLITSSIANSPNGWERQVFRIPADKVGGATSIKIYVGPDSNVKEERYVYFDDINIEPVLHVGNNKYVAKECRLYPTQDATSCTSKNSQVVSDGLVGYCLQHDLANKNVCLLWYPIDEISADSKSARSSLGYQGAYPLNYCTEANGNFTLVKKAVLKIIHKSKDTSSSGSHGFIHSNSDSCTTINASICGDTTNYIAIATNRKENWNYETVYCVPKSGDNVIISGPTTSIQFCGGTYLSWAWVKYNKINKVSTIGCNYDGCEDPCSDGCSSIDEMNSADPPIRVYDYNYPTIDEEELKLIYSSDPDEVYLPTCNNFAQLVDSAGNNKAWANRTNKSSVYPVDTPLFFRDATNYYGQAETCYLNQSGCLSYCECNNQCECWQNGDNCMGECSGLQVGDCADYGTIKVPVSCSTPNAIHEPSLDGFNFTSYGRNRASVPFGAATFPDGFNIFASEPVKFLNQYSSKIDQQAFAGRPYDCDNGSGTGCANIGYCSLNPNMICILDNTTSSSTSLINQRSCGSANGTCVPLWNSAKLASATQFKPEYILKNLFLKSFAGYSYDFGANVYNLDPNAAYHDSTVSSGSYVPKLSYPCSSSSNHLSPNNDGSYNTYWCGVQPKISNVKIDGQSVTSTSIVIKQGIHELTFNSMVDPDQQPLKDLIISWGDGSLQTLVNEDSQSDPNNPHKIYHYFANDIPHSNIDIRIKVSDNWGFYCCSRNDANCSTSCPQ